MDILCLNITNKMTYVLMTVLTNKTKLLFVKSIKVLNCTQIVALMQWEYLLRNYKHRRQAFLDECGQKPSEGLDSFH